jgi:hypothetical protein
LESAGNKTQDENIPAVLKNRRNKKTPDGINPPDRSGG